MDIQKAYEICIEGFLPDSWSDWFNGMVIHNDTEGETTLIGRLPDQASLIGILNKIQALNLSIISVKSIPPEECKLD